MTLTTWPPCELAPQRAQGRLALALRYDGETGRSRIVTFRQQGCLKARLPRSAAAGIRDIVTMNISGGVAGGDELATAISLGAGSRACVAGLAAERVYRAQHGPALIDTRLAVAPGAVLHYLPQETILFDGFALRRTLEIDLAADAGFLGVESLVFGRQAMGETIGSGTLRDSIVLRRDGKVLLRDMTRMDGDIAARLRRGAIGNGAMAMALIINADANAAAGLAPLRALLATSGCEAGATVIDGVVLIRVLAGTAISLRHCVAAALRLCRGGAALPPVWQS